MALYDSLFDLMDCQSAQVLVTSNDFADADFRKNLSSTVEDLLAMNVVPVFNENDAISRKSAQEQVKQPTHAISTALVGNECAYTFLYVFKHIYLALSHRATGRRGYRLW